MPRLYQARDITDASLVRELLVDHGIEAQVRGAALQGGAGELPPGSLVYVWVPDADRGRAMDLVARWERGDFSVPDEPEDAQGVAAPPARSCGRTAALALVAGAAIGAGLVWVTTHGPTQATAIDHDGDGRIDERFFESPTGLDRIETDRNRDGRVDEVLRFRGGWASSVESDNDFNGTMETRGAYRANLWRETESDWNGDGLADYRAEADAGVISREQWMDPAGHVVKQVLYARGRPVSVEFDAQGDGTMERRHPLDVTAEPVAR